MLPAFLAGVAGIAVLAVHGRRVSRRLLAELDERLPRGADGLVLGAGTIDLPGDDRRAVLLVHGFGDTPQSLGAVACRLHAAGWSVRAPLLPGHGRSLADFARSRADEWVETTRAELAALRARYPTVAVVGQSMGGALSAIVVADALRESAGDAPPVAALALLAPYLGMPAGVRVLAPIARAVAPLWPYHDGGAGTRSIQDEAERARSRGYGVLPGVLLAELAKVVDRARAALPHVTVPTLVVQSRADHRISPAVCEDAFARLGAAEKHLVWLDASGHVIAADRERQRVAGLVEEWVGRAGLGAGGRGLGRAEAELRRAEDARADDASASRTGG